MPIAYFPMDRLEATQDAELEASLKMMADEKDYCMSDPDSLMSAIDGAEPKERKEFFRLLANLIAHNLAPDNRPNAWIELRDISHTIQAFNEHIESLVEDHLENAADE